MVLWMISDRSGCGVYRCIVPALGLKDRGHTDSNFCERKHMGPQAGGKLDFSVLDGVSAVVLQRPGAPVLRQWMVEIQRRGLPLLIEIDDDVWHIGKHNPAYGYWQQRAVRDLFLSALDRADAILVSTPALAEQVRAHTGRADAVVAYNHLNDAVWGDDVLRHYTRKPDPLGRVVIGWQGSPTHEQDFGVVVGALRRVLDAYPHAVLRLFGSVPSCVRGTIIPQRFEYAKGVPFEAYPLMLKGMQFDIMLAPLAPSVFNESKSNIRWLEASALSLPTVASDVGPYRIITHGETGLVARTEDEWVEHLSALIESEDLRRRIGAAAFETVWRDWGHDRVEVWADALKRVWPTATAAS